MTTISTVQVIEARKGLYVVPSIDRRARSPRAMSLLVYDKLAPCRPGAVVRGTLVKLDGSRVGVVFSALGWRETGPCPAPSHFSPLDDSLNTKLITTADCGWCGEPVAVRS